MTVVAARLTAGTDMGAGDVGAQARVDTPTTHTRMHERARAHTHTHIHVHTYPHPHLQHAL